MTESIQKSNLISTKQIRDAILDGCILTRAGELIPETALPENFRENDVHHLPPFLHAAFETEHRDSAAPNEVEALEKLSLAMRVKTLGITNAGAHPKAIIPDWHALAVQYIQTPAHISGKDFAHGVICAANEIKRGTIGKNNAVPVLKLVGISIKGDIDLSKAKLPFSIRLIGCSVDGALLLDRTSLDTLDLTGSVIKQGISANYLMTRGAVRLRRVVSLAPLDFGGVNVASTLDATDIVLVPLLHHPNSVSFVGDRSMLNLSLAEIAKDVRLIRARIYGGLNLRGATIDGSVFFTEMIVRSPLATLEINLVEQLQNYGDVDISPSASVSKNASFDLARLLHKSKYHDDFDRRGRYTPATYERAIETLHQLDSLNEKIAGNLGRKSLLSKILFESDTCRECSIRAENVTIRGNLFATLMRSCGQVRLRYAKIDGRVDMKAVRLREAHSVLKQISSLYRELPYKADMNSTLEGLADCIRRLFDIEDKLSRVAVRKKLESQLRDSLHTRSPVLDLEEAKIGGILDLGKCHTRKGPKYTRMVDESTNEEVEKELYRYGDRALIRSITKTLYESYDDPIKFRDIFYPHDRVPPLRPDLDSLRDPNEEPNEARLLTDGLLQLAEAYDRSFYTVFVKARKDLLAEYQKRPNQSSNWRSRHAKSEAQKFRDFAKCQRDSAQDFSSVKTYARAAEVCDVLSNYGELRSSLIIGQINISSAEIEGHLKLRGVIANVFGAYNLSDIDDKVLTFLEGKYCEIGGDVDCRGSLGISGVNLDYSKIGGGVKFYTKADFDPRTDLYKPMQDRALLVSYKGQAYFDPKNEPYYNSGCTIRFKSAKIGGNAQLLFDPKTGPALKLFNATISGNLSIAPVFGSFESTPEEFEQRTDAAKRIRDGGQINPFRRIQNLFARRPDKIDRDSADVRAVYRIPKPVIDLRNASATVFGHSPRAWPQQDGLRINGFRYARTRATGPLVPMRRSWMQIDRDRNYNKGAFICALIVTVGVLMIGLGLSHWDKIAVPGMFNSLMLLAILYVFGLSFGLSHYSRPNYQAAKPQAIYWLQLQRRQFNTRKMAAGVVPLEPYIRAATALRAAGRIRSANMVELERLRHRRRALSLRHQFLLRFILKLADILMEFGFKPMRLVLALLCAVLFGGIVANYAAQRDIVIASDRQRLILAYEMEGRDFPEMAVQKQTNDTHPKISCEGEKCAKPDLKNAVQLTTCALRNSAPNYPRFISTLYAVDIIIPFFDLNQDKYWSVIFNESDIWFAPISSKKANRDGQTANSLNSQDTCRLQQTAAVKNGKVISGDEAPGATNFTHWNSKIAWLIILLLELSGWLVTSVIAVSVVSRIETILARNEEF